MFSHLANVSIPILVTKHIGADGDEGMLEVLRKQSLLPVRLAMDKGVLSKGTIYLAPGGYHLQVEAKGVVSLSLEAPVRHVRPSIDVLFQSAASVYGERVVALILTGANDDGAEGISTIKQYGGVTIAEDPVSAEMKIMPQAAISTGHVDYVVGLRKLPAFLQTLL
ncbi:hypothetical protein ACH42_08790 [Endozoicomonas sp. (ex Bugula neritina AB1)]|nr:hypothetical protein ACH42_08790 [Endozoicomonas sp. (ex Bugula neritina AB1)]